ncbi:hypothetical protein P43SY_001052 [Pythium insidiosum]|uniref:Uncharacterized protein n=1 Tax=Pythium insidiosum TaxID=114742 RepID=A0AAD5Q779_PYTIN|nr:hypothetical protein P43SY_001052 [Pythium insidiosum]
MSIFYALGQYAKPTASATKRAAWEQTIAAMLSGRVDVGSRHPVADAPLWATPEVINGGFATGQLVASLPRMYEDVMEQALGLDQVEQSRQARRRAVQERLALTPDGLSLLSELLNSRCYHVEVPEEACLLVYVWLLDRGHLDAAKGLLEKINPSLHHLRLYPAPTATPIDMTRAALRSLSEVLSSCWGRSERSDGTGSDDRRRGLQRRRLWSAIVLLWRQTLDDVSRPPTGEYLETKVRNKRQFRVDPASAWPCQRYPKDWCEQAKQVVAAYEAEPKAFSTAFYAQMIELIRRAAADPTSLTGCEVGWIRFHLAQWLVRRGAEEDERYQNYWQHTEKSLQSPERGEISPFYKAVISQFNAILSSDRTAAGSLPRGVDMPPWLAQEDAKRLLHEMANAFPRHKELPKLSRRVEACTGMTFEELVDSRALTSPDALAGALLTLTAGVLGSQVEGDAAATYLSQQLHSAFFRRRSLLLFNYESQVRLSELPWSQAFDAAVKSTGIFRADKAQTFAQRVVLHTFRRFGELPMRNTLLRSLRTLFDDAGVDCVLVEELAADIFMGNFTPKFAAAYRTASELLRGSCYDRYYSLYQPNGEQVDFGALCHQRKTAVAPGRSSYVVANGMVIEQSQILTTHNMATLFVACGLQSRLTELQVPEILRSSWRRLLRTVTLIGRAHDKWTRGPFVRQLGWLWRQLVFWFAIVETSMPTQYPSLVAEFNEFVARHGDEVAAVESLAEQLRDLMRQTLVELMAVPSGHSQPRVAMRRSSTVGTNLLNSMGRLQPVATKHAKPAPVKDDAPPPAGPTGAASDAVAALATAISSDAPPTIEDADDADDCDDDKLESSKNLSVSLQLEMLRGKLARRNKVIEVIRRAYYHDVILVKEELRQSRHYSAHSSNSTLQSSHQSPPPPTSRTTTPSATGRATTTAPHVTSLLSEDRLSAVPSVDLRDVLPLFAPAETVLKVHPCETCGGHLELVHGESKELQAARQEMARATKGEQQMKTVVHRLRTEAKELGDVNEALQQRVKALVKENSYTLEQLQASRKFERDQKTLIANLRSKVQLSQAAQEDLERLTIEFKDVKQQLIRSNHDRDIFSASNNHLKEELAEVSRTLHQVKVEKAQIESDFGTTYYRLQEELKRSRQLSEELASEHEKLLATTTLSDELQQSLTALKDEFSTTLQRFEQTKRQLEDQLVDEERAREEMQEQNLEFRKINRKLQKDIEQLQRDPLGLASSSSAKASGPSNSVGHDNSNATAPAAALDMKAMIRKRMDELQQHLEHASMREHDLLGAAVRQADAVAATAAAAAAPKAPMRRKLSRMPSTTIITRFAPAAESIINSINKDGTLAGANGNGSRPGSRPGTSHGPSDPMTLDENSASSDGLDSATWAASAPELRESDRDGLPEFDERSFEVYHQDLHRMVTEIEEHKEKQQKQQKMITLLQKKRDLRKKVLMDKAMKKFSQMCHSRAEIIALELTRLTDNTERLRSDLEQAESKIDSDQLHIRTLEAEVSKLRLTVDVGKNNLARTEKALKQVTDELQDTTSKCTSQLDELRKLRDALESMKEDERRLTILLFDKTKAWEREINTNERSAQRIGNLEETVREISAERDALEAKQLQEIEDLAEWRRNTNESVGVMAVVDTTDSDMQTDQWRPQGLLLRQRNDPERLPQRYLGKASVLIACPGLERLSMTTTPSNGSQQDASTDGPSINQETARLNKGTWADPDERIHDLMQLDVYPPRRGSDRQVKTSHSTSRPRMLSRLYLSSDGVSQKYIAPGKLSDGQRPSTSAL